MPNLALLVGSLKMLQQSPQLPVGSLHVANTIGYYTPLLLVLEVEFSATAKNTTAL
jgi:hypothetical protein